MSSRPKVSTKTADFQGGQFMDIPDGLYGSARLFKGSATRLGKYDAPPLPCVSVSSDAQDCPAIRLNYL